MVKGSGMKTSSVSLWKRAGLLQKILLKLPAKNTEMIMKRVETQNLNSLHYYCLSKLILVLT